MAVDGERWSTGRLHRTMVGSPATSVVHAPQSAGRGPGLTPGAQAPGASQTTPSGGMVSTAEWGSPCHSRSSASRVAPTSIPLPP